MTDKMREVWDAHDKARNKAWREEPGTFDTLDAFKAGAAWQAAKSVPDAELERLRKDAERYAVVRDSTYCDVYMHEIYLTDDDLDAAIDAATAGEKK